MLEEVDDLVGRAFLRVEHQVYSQLLEQQFVLGREVVLVVDARYHLAGAEALGDQGADYVYLLSHARADSDEEVGLVRTCLLEHLYRGQVAADRVHVGGLLEIRDSPGIVVDDGDFVRLRSEHLREMGSDFSRAFNDYSHNSSDIRIFLFRAMPPSGLC